MDAICSRVLLRRLLPVLAVIGLTGAGAHDRSSEESAVTRIRVIVGEEVLPATLVPSAAAREFADMLPLELTMTDYNGTEKVADLGRKLDARGSSASYAPRAGDITQYRPWANLAIFYKPFRESAGLLRLGAFDGPFDALSRGGDVRVRIELAD